jgi:hypothetical protein
VLLAAEVALMSAYDAAARRAERAERAKRDAQAAREAHDAGPAPRAQWVGLFLAPAAFFTHLQVRYVLVPWACATNGQIWIHVVDVLALALALLGAFFGWRTWQSAGREDPSEAGGAIPRTRMMGAMGVGTSLMFALVLLGQWTTSFFFSACQ